MRNANTIDEIVPVTSEGLVLYIDECRKEMARLAPMVSAYNKCKRHLKFAQERLQKNKGATMQSAQSEAEKEG